MLFQELTNESLFAACVAAIEDHSKLKRNAEFFSHNYRKYHNPTSFMRKMLGVRGAHHDE